MVSAYPSNLSVNHQGPPQGDLMVEEEIAETVHEAQPVSGLAHLNTFINSNVGEIC